MFDGQEPVKLKIQLWKRLDGILIVQAFSITKNTISPGQDPI